MSSESEYENDEITSSSSEEELLAQQGEIFKQLYEDGGLGVENIIEIKYLMELIKYVPENYKDKQDSIIKCLELLINLSNQFLHLYNKKFIEQ
tara:strand:- start:3771 stop:4049 length:279 start_codon:yes stop_codon:yes gene_type:complete